VFTSGEIKVRLISGKIQITVNLETGESFSLDDYRFVLENRIPAHLAFSFTFTTTIDSFHYPAATVFESHSETINYSSSA
jgi:hypothetical protein